MARRRATLPTWPDEIYRVLKDAGIRQVAMVPDAGHSRLIRSFEADPESVVTLTSEEEGWRCCRRLARRQTRRVLMQSSGVGNCVNMLSVPAKCGMPLLMLVTMRGEWGEFNPWQVSMGQGTRPCSKPWASSCADEPDDVESTVQGAATWHSTAEARSRCCSYSATSAPRTSRRVHK